MVLRMEPRKITDRGGWLCMPLVKNVPEGKEGVPYAENFVGKDQRTLA